MLPILIDDKEYKYRGRGFRIKERISSWIRLIFAETASRNLFLFLCLNLCFAFVEFGYGMLTNSLGLISDSFHMFFDCTALVAGLFASVIMKWRPNERFTYGYVRAEVLAGFVNGLFLVFIAFYIFTEAIERVMEPPEVKHERLFLVSVAGFIVNLIGIFAFQHGHAHGGHGHSHGGGGHGHSHGGPAKQTDNILLSMNSNHGHSHNGNVGHAGHGHGHSHGERSSDVSSQAGNSQIMHGVFLHILADTLGSVGVIISAILMNQFGWMIADPICSMFIAALIVMSVYPLLKESICILMQRTPRTLENSLQQCYQRVTAIEGVYSVQEKHFWTLCSDVYVGTIKLEVAKRADLTAVMSQTQSIFQQAGVNQLYVQMDYAAM